LCDVIKRVLVHHSLNDLRWRTNKTADVITLCRRNTTAMSVMSSDDDDDDDDDGDDDVADKFLFQ